MTLLHHVDRFPQDGIFAPVYMCLSILHKLWSSTGKGRRDCVGRESILSILLDLIPDGSSSSSMSLLFSLNMFWKIHPALSQRTELHLKVRLPLVHQIYPWFFKHSCSLLLLCPNYKCHTCVLIPRVINILGLNYFILGQSLEGENRTGQNRNQNICIGIHFCTTLGTESKIISNLLLYLNHPINILSLKAI